MGANIADLVTQSADRTPNKPALICADRTVAWSELERLVRAVAGGLAARGLGKGDRVAMMIGNTPEFVSTYFGVLRAGMVAGVIVNRTQQEIPNAETMARTESDAIKIVLGAARKLI